MKNASQKTTLALAVLMFAVVAAAQNPPATPKPGPEIEKLKYFVGEWKQEGAIAASHMANAGKYTGTYHNAMAPGGFFVEMHSTNESGMGKWTATSFLGYNAQDKVYTYDEFDSTGGHTVAKGKLEGDTWTWTNESKMGDKTMNGRYTEKITSPTSYDFKFESSEDGGKTYSTFLEGKATRTAGPAGSKTGGAAAAKGATAEKSPAKPKGGAGDAKGQK